MSKTGTQVVLVGAWSVTRWWLGGWDFQMLTGNGRV